LRVVLIPGLRVRHCEGALRKHQAQRTVDISIAIRDHRKGIFPIAGYLVSFSCYMNVTSIYFLPLYMIRMTAVHSIVPPQPKQSTIPSREREYHGKIADVDHVFPDYDREYASGSFDN
jgi:hypothetical protein